MINWYNRSIFDCLSLLFFFIAASLTSLSVGAEQSRLYDAHYQGEIKGFSFDTVRSLYQEDETTFSFISVSKRPLAYLREGSRMKLLNGVLVPMNYNYRAKILGISRDHSISYDWIMKKARFERSDKPERNRDLVIGNGYLDPLSMQLEIQRAGVQGLDSIKIEYIRKDRDRTETFRRTDTSETIKLDGKTLQTVLYKSLYKDKTTEVYLVPALSYAIGKIRYVDDEGDEAEVELYKYRVNEEKRSDLTQFLRSMGRQLELTSSN